jgi:hypothetical protein
MIVSSGQVLSQLGETSMPTLSAPTIPIFWVSVALAVLALIGHFTKVQFLTEYQFWLAIAGYVVLFLGNILKGL